MPTAALLQCSGDYVSYHPPVQVVCPSSLSLRLAPPVDTPPGFICACLQPCGVTALRVNCLQSAEAVV